MDSILLGHLNSLGDCLFATVIARQIKEVDFPGCRLTWAIGAGCRNVIRNNPYVDDIWEVPTEHHLADSAEWEDFAAEAERRKANGEFDHVFLTQIISRNWVNFDGGIRSSVYNNYPFPISVPHQPVVRLTPDEIENVRKFAHQYRLGEYKSVILIEYSSESFCNALNEETGPVLAEELASDDSLVILTSRTPRPAANPRILDASSLSFRENLELARYCNLFIGCSSGISWLLTSDTANRLDSILVINRHNYVFPSMIYDHNHLGMPTNHIIEVISDHESIAKVIKCVRTVRADGFESARSLFNENLTSANYDYMSTLLQTTITTADWENFRGVFHRNFRRNGLRLMLRWPFLKGVTRGISAGIFSGLKMLASSTIGEGTKNR